MKTSNHQFTHNMPDTKKHKYTLQDLKNKRPPTRTFNIINTLHLIKNLTITVKQPIVK